MRALASILILIFTAAECQAEPIQIAAAASRGVTELHLTVVRAEVSRAPAIVEIELRNDGRYPVGDLALAAECHDETGRLTESIKSRRRKLSPGETWTVRAKIQHFGKWSLVSLSGQVHTPLGR
jgi:hypothetical protein